MVIKRKLADLIAADGASREEVVKARIVYEGFVGLDAKCCVTGRKTPWALALEVPREGRPASRIAPLAPAAVRSWLDALVRGSHMDRLEGELSRAEASAKSAAKNAASAAKRKAESVGLRRRMEEEEVKNAKARQAASAEARERMHAKGEALQRARREMADPEARERILQRKFLARHAETLRLYFEAPEAAADEELKDCVANVFAARCFTSEPQRRFVYDRTRFAVNKALLAGKRTPKCGTCGAGTELRSGRHGPFWGCLSFPDCRWAKDADEDIERAKASAERKKERVC